MKMATTTAKSSGAQRCGEAVSVMRVPVAAAWRADSSVLY